MNKILISLFFCLIAICIVFCSIQKKNMDVQWKTVTGKTVYFNQYIQPTPPIRIVNVWASWCEPCLYEIPDFIRLQEEFKQQIAIFGLNIDQNEDKLTQIKAIQKKLNPNYPLLFSETKSDPFLKTVKAIPTTYFVDSLGNILNTFVGYTPYEVIKAEINHLLTKK